MRSKCLLGCLVALTACDAKPAAAVQPKVQAETQAKPEAATPAAKPRAAKAPEAPPAPKPEAEIGKPAPEFELTDLDGKAHKLSDYKGKTVVLEWFNPECPFVNFAHDKGPLKDMASQQSEQGVVWIAINSGGPGKQGHGVEKNKAGLEKFGVSHPVLLDEDGAVGHRFGAVKTPHMFLVNPQGVLRYAGAIDNAPFGEADGDAEHVNHLEVALTDLREGREVAQPSTKAYGCTVKYGRT